VITKTTFLIWLAALLALAAPVEGRASEHGNEHDDEQGDMVYIDGGNYVPLLRSGADSGSRAVAPFYLDRYAVTNRQYLLFTDQYPKWKKESVKHVFADSNYLAHWPAATLNESADSPVTNVSWFSARAYCKSLGKRLPSLDEWEFVARSSESAIDGSHDPSFRQKILEWYSRPATKQLRNVKDTEANYWGVHGMHGVVWEMVNDFNTALVTGESRADAQLDKQLFCGAGAASSYDPGDYAAFMRYAFRSSYRAAYTMDSLGFRCAKDATNEPD
jgi:formylglycine-generating enzyme required for sulfatase activity